LRVGIRDNAGVLTAISAGHEDQRVSMPQTSVSCLSICG